jgi:hypothetical protein
VAGKKSIKGDEMKKMKCFIVCVVMAILWKGHETAYNYSNSNTYRYSKGTVLSSSFDLAVDYLKASMDAFHNTFDVYTDISAAGNHFPTLTMVPDEKARVGMDQCCTENPFSGSTCTKCTFQSQGNNYGGYYFLNGTLTGDETEPQANWGDEPDAETLRYKSTEHNLDLYVVFQRLYEITSDDTWRQRAVHAETFIKSMWDKTEGKFYKGTDNTGIIVNDEVIPLDAQTWAILAFREKPELYSKALAYAEMNHRAGEGYDFNTDRDGIWCEGTAQMAVAYQVVGDTEKANACITAVEKAQYENGAIPAASRDGLIIGNYRFVFIERNQNQELKKRYLHITIDPK